jgi:hypothetical protein
MTLEETIEHTKEIAERCEKEGIFVIPQNIKECGQEYAQIAEWLSELKRAKTLLKATHELLNKQVDSYYVLNMLAETVFYDDAECDGSCLMEDIEAWLEDIEAWL